MKRVISLLLCLSIVLSLSPTMVFAEELQQDTNVLSVEENLNQVSEETSESSAEDGDTSSEDILLSSYCGGEGDGTNLTWTLNADGTLTISGSGEMANYDYRDTSTIPWYQEKSSVKCVVVEDGVTSIGDSAFFGCSSLTSITLPGSVTTIGDSAFRICSSLTSITVPDGVTTIGDSAFLSCTSLTSITLPGSVTTIGDSAFIRCLRLTSITIPDSVISIGVNAFSTCNSLTTVIVDPENPAYSSDEAGVLFNKSKTELLCYPSANTLTTYDIPDSVTTIGASAFYNCDNLTSITIPDSVISIGVNAFSACYSLTEAEIGSGVTANIEGIYGSSSLTTVVVDPENPAYSSDDAGVLFNKSKTELLRYPSANTLTTYDIPDSVTTIGASAFYNCDNLTSIVIPDSVTAIGDEAFSSCSSLTSITISDSVTSIGARSFYGCDSLTVVEIGSGVTANIEDIYESDSLTTVIVDPENPVYSSDDAGVLFNKSNTELLRYPRGNPLTTYDIPDSVTTIGASAFYNCDNLTSITIPSSVTSIGIIAFGACDNLISVTFQGNAPSIGEDAFYTVTATISYPENWPTSVLQQYGGTITWEAILLDSTIIGSGNCGLYDSNVTWKLNREGKLTISGTGEMKDFLGYDSVPWYESRENIKTVIIHDGITCIGNYAFYNCWELTDVTIPDSITRIGNSAFEACGSLYRITLPDGITDIGDSAFADSSILPKITIPENVTYYNYEMYSKVSSITTEDGSAQVDPLSRIIFVGDAPSFESLCFSGVYSMVFYPDNNETWMDDVFDDYNGNVIWVPYSPTETSGYCGGEGDGTNLTWVLDSTGTLTISGTGKMADYNESSPAPWWAKSSSVKSIVIQNGVTSIGDFAFSICDWLNQVTIPESVETIGAFAFAYCMDLPQITIPGNVTSIGNGTFAFCRSLKEISIPEGIPSIGDYTFYYTGLTSFVIPDSVVSIGESNGWSVFCGSDLQTIEVGAGITSGLSNVIKNHGLTFISVDPQNPAYSSDDDGVLYNKSKTELILYPRKSARTSYNIPASVTSIGTDAFSYSYNLTEVTFEGNAPSIDEDAFCGVTATVFYPENDETWAEVRNDYGGTLTWKTYAKHIHTEEVIPAVSATCTETGLTAGVKCSDCGEILTSQEVVPVLSHTEVVDAAVAPTCTETGLTEGTHCSVCNEVIVAQTEVAALGHSWVDATCVTLKTCSTCGKTEGEHAQNHTGLKELTSNGAGWLLADGVAVSSNGTLPAGNYYLGENITIDTTIKIADDVKICLNGKVLRYQSENTGSVFYVSNGSLRIYDCGTATHGYDIENTGLWVWNDEDGDYRLSGGAITGGTGYSSGQYGGAVFISSGTFELHGGNLVGNTAVNGGAIAGDKYYDHTICIYDSRIVGNVANGGDGGAIYTRGIYSDGQYNALTTLVISNTRIDQNVAEDGGAIAGGGNVTLEGCTLRKNQAEYWGGALYITGGSLTITDCTITENTAVNNAGAVYTNVSPTVSGLIRISDNTCTAADGAPNLYLNTSTAVITIDDAFSRESCIGIKRSVPTSGVFTGGGGSTYQSCFTSDDPDCHITVLDGELCFEAHISEEIPAVSVTCTEDGLTAGAKCSVCDKVLTAQEVVPALGHTEVTDAAVAPTCTEKGRTEGTHCSVCNEVIVAQEEVAALGHSWGDWITVKEATETEEGEKTHTCTACGEVESQRIPKLDHVHNYSTVVTAPTCLEQGYTTYACACGDSYITDYVSALGHTDVIDEAVAPTCTETGLTEGKHCSVCNEVIVAQTEVAELGHTEVTIPVVAATCTETGLTAGVKCSACGEVLTAQEVVPALGHSWGDWSIVKEATEDETGEKTRACTSCGEVESQSIPKLDHVHSYSTSVTVPTCLEQGYTTYTCACGDSYVSDYVEALGHTEVIDAAVGATCTEKGKTEGKHCSVCNEVLVAQTDVEALGHIEVIDTAVAPTCTETGLTEGKQCSVCREVIAAQEEIAALGHSWSDWTTVKEATEAEEGEKTRTCTVCNEQEHQSIPRLEHTHNYAATVTEPTCVEQGYTTYTCTCGDSYVSDSVDALGHTEVIDEAVEPTCTEKGKTEGKHCSVCNEVLVAQTDVDANDHSWTDANCVAPKTCSICGVTDGERGQNHSGLKELTSDGAGWLLVDGVSVSSNGKLPAGDYYLGDNITIDTTIKIADDVKICLNGKVLRYQSENTGSVFYVSNGSLRIYDCGTATHGYDIENTGLWVWNDEDGDYRLSGGAITGGTGYSSGQYGGAVFISSGTFELHGGNLVGNTAVNGGAIAGDKYYDHTIRICDSRIVGNVANSGDGGAIYTRGVGSSTDQYDELTTLVIFNTRIDQNVAEDGGAIAGGGSVTLEGCVLRKNSAAYAGGAIYMSAGSLALTDCTIKENTATRNVGGMHVAAPLTVSGLVYIYDNTCMATDGTQNLYVNSESAVITIAEEFSSESYIGIKLSSNRVFTSGGGSAYRACFVSEDSSCHIAASDGELCFETHTSEEIPAVAVTCTETGLTAGAKCSVCGEILTAQEVVPAPGHTEETITAVAATCTETGLTAGVKCSACGMILTAQEVVSALGHTEEIIPAVAASCTETGLTAGVKCSVCGKVLTAQETVPTLEHSWGDWTTVKEATEDEAGEKTRTCAACGEVESQSIPKLDHVHSYSTSVTVPTCLEQGYTTYTCACGDSYVSDYVDALGHTEVVDGAVAPTCTKTGLTEGKHCSVCNEVIVAQTEVAGLGHTEETIPAVAATCTETGLTAGVKCSVCGKILAAQEVVPVLGHTEETIPAVAATCTETGLTAGVKCSVCGKVLTAQQTIPALEHSWGDWTTVKEATETEEGEKTHTCTACGEVESQSIPKLDHIHSYSTSVTVPTCLEQGYTTYTCACGDSYVNDYVDALGHTEVIDAAVAPACTTTGLTEGKHCLVCNATIVAQEEVAALGHTEVIDTAVEATCTETGLTEGAHCSVCNEVLVAQIVVGAKSHTEVIDAAVEPACTTTGLTEGKHCSVCSEVIVAQKEVPALGHSWSDWTTITEPTETEAGEKTRTCTACNSVESQSIPTLDHVHNYNTAVTAPTCLEQGYTTYTCLCGETYVSDYVDALGHTEVVDAAVAPTCTATGLTDGKHCSVCNVTIIAQTVVAKTEHDSVTDPAVEPTCTTTGLTEGSHCANCGAIIVAQSTVPAKEHSWENMPGAFMQKCTNCQIIREVDTLTGESDGITWELTKNGTLTFYGNGTISDLSAITPFAGDIKKIVIESDVSGVQTGAFTEYSALESFDVSEDNTNLTSADGVLFGQEETISLLSASSELSERGMTILLAYPMGRTDTSYTVPGTDVAPFAFAGNPYLTSVTFEENVEQIAQSAFNGCIALKEVNLPASLQSIGMDAFKDCPLDKVVYSGDSEAWKQVEMESTDIESDPIQNVEPVFFTVKAQWNLNHSVLSIVGLPADAERIFVAFMSDSGQMVKVVDCTPQQIIEGIDIPGGEISFKNCTAKIMLIGEGFVPVLDSLTVN